MAIHPPNLDTRTHDQLVAQIETLATQWAEWVPPPKGQMDAGRALIHIFAKMTGVVISRLNQVPDKNFLAFLDLIGTHILPPQPARVPLTFGLAPGSTEANLVSLPTGTQVSAPPPEGESEEVVFETDQDLGVTSAHLHRVMVHQPDADQYGNSTASVAHDTPSPFPIFEGNMPIEHSLYLANDDLWLLPDPKNVILIITSPDAARLAAWPMNWSYWDGSGWTSLQPWLGQTRVRGNQWFLQFVNLPMPQRTTVNGRTAAWFRSSLTTPLAPTQIRQHHQPVAAAHSGQQDLDVTQPFFPFGPSGENTTFYLYLEPLLQQLPPSMLKMGGTTFSLHVTFTNPGRATSTLVLTWEYFLGNGKWKTLGQVRPQDSESVIHDETKAFTQDGTASFPLPSEQTQDTLHGRPGRWIRIRITKGNYGTGRNAKPPHIHSLKISYDWRLPVIDQIATNVLLTQSGRPLETGFTNTQPLSVDKDFFPFGERPRFNDTVFLALHRDTAKPGTRITMHLTLSAPLPNPIRASQDLVLGWEVHTHSGWVPIQGMAASHPDVLKMVRSGSITFTLPIQSVVSTIQHETQMWIRVRILRGNYGVEATFTRTTVTINGKKVSSYAPVPATFGPPSIKTITYDYRATPSGPLHHCHTYNDFTYQDHTAVTRTADNQTFAPFMPSTETRPALYLAFDRPFANRLITLFADVDAPQPGEMSGRKPVKGRTPRIQWEYATPSGWRSLGAQDETDALTKSGLIRFLGPTPFPQTSHFNHHAFWVRAQWTTGTFPTQPRLNRILTNTMWASQASTIQGEILGSGTGEPDQTFQATHAPILLGQQLSVREPDIPQDRSQDGFRQGDPRTKIQVVLDETGHTQEVWVDWDPVTDFHGSGPQDRHYVIDHLTGRITFGNGQQGMAPPRGHHNIRLTQYRSGGGTRGNLPAHTITQLKSSIAYIAEVTNLTPSEGGSAREHPDRFRTRGPKTLRHRGRAVTAQDIEDLALEGSPDVVRALAITPRFDPIALEWMPTYSFFLDGPGDITVTATWQGEQTMTLQLCGPGQGNPYIQKTGRSPLTLTYSVRQDSVYPKEEWSVQPQNHHDIPITGGTLAITYPVGSLSGPLNVPSQSAHEIQNTGRVELIIVPRGVSSRPTPDLALIQRLENYIQSRLAPTVEFWITEPDWVKVTVAVVIVPQSFQLADRVREQALSALSRFLHPLHGGTAGQGWPFGRAPHQSDLLALLESLDGVDHIQSLAIQSDPSLGGEEGNPEATPLPKDRFDRFLIFSGDHQVTMAASTDTARTGA